MRYLVHLSDDLLDQFEWCIAIFLQISLQGAQYRSGKFDIAILSFTAYRSLILEVHFQELEV